MCVCVCVCVCVFWSEQLLISWIKANFNFMDTTGHIYHDLNRHLIMLNFDKNSFSITLDCYYRIVVLGFDHERYVSACSGQF